MSLTDNTMFTGELECERLRPRARYLENVLFEI